MKLAVFVCLLVSFQVVAGSCINKTVEVLVADGVGLTGDFIGKPDPYVVVHIGGETQKTRVIKSSSNPNWRETLKFNSTSADLMKIELWEQDWGLGRPDDHLGTCTEQLSQSNTSTAVLCKAKASGVVKLFYDCH